LIREQARGISLFEPDLLVLTEVDHHTAIDELAQTLRTDFNLPYDSLIIDQNQTNLDIGILFKEDVEVGQRGLIDGSALGGQLRKAYWADVRIGQFDFRVIGIHFKSGGSVSTRRDQAKVVAAFVTEFVHGAEKDVLLIGDYNMFPRRDRNVFPILSAEGFLRFISSESLCTPPDLDPCVGTHIQANGNQAREGNLLDGFAISSNHTGELQGEVSRVNLPTLMGLSLGSYKSQVTDHYPIVATFRIDQDDDGGSTSSSLKITRLIPNPPGNDSLHEEVTLKNFSTDPISLIDWTLRDLAGRTWFLDELGTIQPQEEKTIRRNGQHMALNNTGDSVDLIDPTGAVIDRVTYPSVTQGEVVQP